MRRGIARLGVLLSDGVYEKRNGGIQMNDEGSRRSLEAVKDIPRGEVRPYAWAAREAGSPKASRAVGSVTANNPVPLVVPCHRVVRNDGRTGQYAFGVREKVGVLEGEGCR